jgi:PIN domain nuclease of toxin-antitoxin system
MNLLLDTHVALRVMDMSLDQTFPQFAPVMRSSENRCFVSIISLWEIAIKVRLGKLNAGVPLLEMSQTLMRQKCMLLQISDVHAVSHLRSEPPTHDPFDRMLLVQAELEGMQLVTIDRALANHPVAFRPPGVSNTR